MPETISSRLQTSRARRFNFNVKEHQTEVTGDHLFAILNIQVEKTNYDVEESIRRLLSGDLAAMMIVTGAPQSALAKLKKEDGPHFVPVDQDSLPGRDFTPVIAEYLPAELTSKTYPNLVPEGTSVPTLANRALLVTYGWPGRLRSLQQGCEVCERVLWQDRRVSLAFQTSKMGRNQSLGRYSRLDHGSSLLPSGWRRTKGWHVLRSSLPRINRKTSSKPSAACWRTQMAKT